MRRQALRGRRAVALAALFLIAGVATPAVAGPRRIVDDRPPLLAVERAPQGVSPASQLVDFDVVRGRDESIDLVLRGDGGLPYELFRLSGPDRLVLDFPGVVANTERFRAEVNSAGLVRVRVAQFRTSPDPVTRVVLELDKPLGWRIARDGDVLRVTLGQAAPAKAAVAAPAPAPAEAKPQPAPAPVAEKPVAEKPVVEKPVVEKPAPAVAKAAPAPAEKPAATRPEVRPRTAAAAPSPFAPAQAQQPAPAPAPKKVAAEAAPPLPPTLFETKTIQDERRSYTGRKISLALVDADIRQVFSMFHDISGMNFVLDPAVSGSVTIMVDEVPWDQALHIILQNNGLEMVLEGNVVRIAPVVKLAQEAAARKALREAKELEANPVTVTRTLSYAKAEDVDKIIREAILSPKGRVILDRRTNTMIVRDIPDRVAAIDNLLNTLDAETPQVMIEARVVEVSRDFIEDFGIKWGAGAYADPAHGTQTNLQFPHRASAQYQLNLPRADKQNSLSFSFGNVLNSFTLDIAIDALETEGYAKRLSSPKIATQNNEAAEIEQGVRFPIVNTTATEIRTEFVSATLKLKATPQITAEGTVILEMEIQNDQPDMVNKPINSVPPINTQRAKTKVLIADGGTTVIGGIFTVNEGRSTTGVPFFNKLPGLGWLFRSKNTTSQNRELLIFVTPRIIRAS